METRKFNMIKSLQVFLLLAILSAGHAVAFTTSSSPFSVATKAPKSTFQVAVAPSSTGAASHATPAATVSGIAVAGDSNQGRVGLIIGVTFGAIGVLFAILAIGLGLFRRRQRKLAEQTRNYNEKRFSTSSFASTGSFGHIRVHSSYSDATVATLNPFVTPPPEERVPTPPPQPPSEVTPAAEFSTLQRCFSNPFTAADIIQEAADLPATWVRPVNPPRIKRKEVRFGAPLPQPAELDNAPQVSTIHPSNSISSQYSRTASLRPSNSVLSNYSRATDGCSIYPSDSVSSRYSRTTDGHSVIDLEGDTCVPPVPELRYSERYGWYRIPMRMPSTNSANHIAFHITSPINEVPTPLMPTPLMPTPLMPTPLMPTPIQPTKNGRNSVTSWSSEDTVVGYPIRNCFEEKNEYNLPIGIVKSLSLNFPPAHTVQKVGRKPVPLLDIPKPPSPDERGNRLYDVPGSPMRPSTR